MKEKFRKKIVLNSNWRFALQKSRGGVSSEKGSNLAAGKYLHAEVPGTIHTDLINNKIIDDSYYGDNELKQEWIAKCDWIYKTDFEIKDNKNYNLVLKGIDTIADVFLNNTKILSCKNMFLEYKIDVKKYLRQSSNELKILFHSPVNFAVKEESKHGKLPVALNSYRVYIRKAQYSYGWDWGPSFPTCGIWREIFLEEKKDAEIGNVLFTTKSISKTKAKVSVSAFVKTKRRNSYKLVARLQNSKKVIEKELKVLKSSEVVTELQVLNPVLWWPNGEGKQKLYELSVLLVDNNNNVIDCVEKKVGIRKIELVLKEKNKNTFKLRINGRDIFAKGVNWIPSDSFIPRVDKAKYKKLLSYTKEADMNIIRVWGGGFYENDDFYNLCDELGLLVWQDFMFACGAYPEHKEFIESVKEEVNQNVKRLQYHPSLAVWCGNNENEWIWYQEQKSSYKNLPGYKIYHDIIPNIIKRIDPLLCYWPSSPFSYEEDPNSLNSGNTHQWEIWSKWVDYEKVKNDKSLFVTEFGFQGPANQDTFEKCLPKANRKISDKLFEFHNKQIEGPERLNKFLSAHLPLSTKWGDYLYLTQLNQGFALKTCLEHWRTNGRTNGSIIWQLNDSWPVTSWAVIDYGLKPKLAYHFVKNIFAKQITSFTNNKNKIDLNILNQSHKSFAGVLKINLINTSTGKVVEKTTKNIRLKANSKISAEYKPAKAFENSENLIALSSLFDSAGSLVNTNYYKEQPWKYFKIAKAKLSLKISGKGLNKRVSVKSNRPAYFVDLYYPGIEFDERGFTILPGDEVVVNIRGEKTSSLTAKDIKIFSLNNYL